MKGLEHPVVTAFGATTIIVITLLAPLVSPLHHELYHFYGPPSALILPVLLNFAAVWIILTLLLAGGFRFRWLNLGLWGILAIFLPWMLMQDCFSLTFGHMSRQANGVFLALLIVVGALLLAMRSRALPLLHQGRRFARVMLGFAALNGALILAQIFWSGWQSRRLDTPRPLHQPATASAGHSRILWIVLDELSYRQLYEHRYPGLELPAFDKLASTATVFTHTVPAGYWTDIVLPSLMSGQPLDKMGAPAAGFPLLVRSASNGAWHPFAARQTVFQDALNAGYQTAVAGWWNPYCRILSDVLDHCFWTTHSELRGGMYSSQSAISNTESPALNVLKMMPWHSPPPDSTYFHQLDYWELLAAGDKLINDPSATFVLLHMPIPHMPGIYNRRTASFAAPNPSYLDNLALCDNYLAHVRKELEDNGTWDNTTLVLMGDHSWRISKGAAALMSPEERAASDGGQFDDRPAYIIKLAHQTTPTRIDTQFPALRTRDLFDNLLTGRITTPQQLATWAQQAPQPAKPQPTQLATHQKTPGAQQAN
ncbi:MAG TPA: sulfatase-like hydrolase/transferase [Edaphobacter sp.]|nr:sulfatase-like hydrolase/transferase [Edaphobacter sp.]